MYIVLQIEENLLIFVCYDGAVTAVFSPSQFDECMFSRILTLDLQPYPLVEEDRENAEKDKTGHE